MSVCREDDTIAMWGQVANASMARVYFLFLLPLMASTVFIWRIVSINHYAHKINLQGIFCHVGVVQQMYVYVILGVEFSSDEIMQKPGQESEVSQCELSKAKRRLGQTGIK